MDCGPAPSDPHVGSLSQVNKLFFLILGMFFSALPYNFPLDCMGAYATDSLCEPFQGYTAHSLSYRIQQV